MSDMVRELKVQNYGCVRNASVSLTPLHALIGPNDSGKSTLLRALRTAVQLAGDHFTVDDGVLKPFDPGLGGAESDFFIEVVWSSLSYRVHGPILNAGALFDVAEEIWIDRNQNSQDRRLVARPSALSDASRSSPSPEAFRFFQRGAHMFRLDPDALREPSPLILTNRPTFQDDRGRGLAGVYDVILNQKVAGFLAIQEKVRALFPGIKAIGLHNVSSSTKILQAQMTSGAWVPAPFLSEGLLYYLAFAAYQHLDPPAMLLIEEPENGLHPARIAEVMRIFREISKETQIVLATHSPLVVNELRPEEVSVVTRTPEAGTKVTRLLDTPDFEARSKIYALGELWIAYANGTDEAPLLEGREP